MNSRLGVTATADKAVLPGVLGCRTLRRTVQVRLGSNPAVAGDGCPVARPSSQSRDSSSSSIRAREGGRLWVVDLGRHRAWGMGHRVKTF